MPELAEVDYFRKQWNPAIGHQVVAVRVHPKSRIFRGVDIEKMTASLTGSTLRDSLAHGKQMLFLFSGNRSLGLHLGMTGKLSMEAADFEPGKHDHLVLVQDHRACVFSDPRHFGRIRFDEGAKLPDWWMKLPPEVTSATFTSELVNTFLRRRAKAPLKAVLLMQERFPGIGNWMADEILWRARFFPNRAAGSLSPEESKLLWKEIRFVSREALKIIGKDWSDPPKSWLFTHRWKHGNDCPRCGTALTRQDIGGRTTCYCPRCQAT